MDLSLLFSFYLEFFLGLPVLDSIMIGNRVVPIPSPSSRTIEEFDDIGQIQPNPQGPTGRVLPILVNPPIAALTA